MVRLTILLCVFALSASACGVLPQADSQIRISEHGSEIDAGSLIGSGAELRGCIVSIVGELPVDLKVVYEHPDSGKCRVTFGSVHLWISE